MTEENPFADVIKKTEEDIPLLDIEKLKQDEIIKMMQALRQRTIQAKNANTAMAYLRCREYLERLNKPQEAGELSPEEIASYGFRALSELQKIGYKVTYDSSSSTETNKTS